MVPFFVPWKLTLIELKDEKNPNISWPALVELVVEAQADTVVAVLEEVAEAVVVELELDWAVDVELDDVGVVEELEVLVELDELVTELDVWLCEALVLDVVLVAAPVVGLGVVL
jgi:hypothetical protein